VSFLPDKNASPCQISKRNPNINKKCPSRRQAELLS
jgi:hypothetical protein